jgi:undecaprenyl-diphosphatase
MTPQATRTVSIVSLVGFVVAGLAAILLGWLSEEMIEGDTRRFDAYVRGTVHSAASPGLTEVMRFFTDVGSIIVLPCLFAAAVLVFWIVRWRLAATLLIVTMAGAAVLDEALKFGFHRPRPIPYFGMAAPHSFSYPSGHALFSFVFFSTLASLLAGRISRFWLRVSIWTASICIIVLIGLSRIYLGVHYPTDVIAGYLTGLIWVTSVSLADRLYRRAGRNA